MGFIVGVGLCPHGAELREAFIMLDDDYSPYITFNFYYLITSLIEKLGLLYFSGGSY